MRRSRPGLIILSLVAAGALLQPHPVGASDPAVVQAAPADSTDLRSEAEEALYRYEDRRTQDRVSGVRDPQSEVRRERRGELIETLDRIAEQIPGDDFVVGHRVGARLVHGPADAALEAARECRGSPGWCLELEATVLHAMDEIQAADSLFREALEEMPSKQRCERESVAALLGEEAAGEYGLRTCAARRALNERFWWLAEPLYIRPGNDRRTEHRSRIVIREWVHVFQAWQWDRRIVTSPTEGCGGGPGVRLQDVPGARDSDGTRRTTPVGQARQHAAQQFPRWALRVGHASSWDHETPAGNCVLTGGGYSFAPDAEILVEPLKIEDGWSLERYSARQGHTTTTDPPEIYDPSYGPFTRLDHQVGFFRRGDSVAVAAATDLGGTLLDGAQEVRVGVVLARNENDEPFTELRKGPGADGPFRFRLDAPESRYLVSLEALAAGEGAGRARFGDGLPENDPDGLAVSDLVLFDWEDEDPPDSLEEMYPRMLGGTRLDGTTSVGLYWEVYGPEADEPFSVAVHTTPPEPGVLRRVGRALGLVGDADPVQVSWEDAADSGPHSSRAVRLDLGELDEGAHTLEVTIETADGLVATTRRVEIVQD